MGFIENQELGLCSKYPVATPIRLFDLHGNTNRPEASIIQNLSDQKRKLCNCEFHMIKHAISRSCIHQSGDYT